MEHKDEGGRLVTSFQCAAYSVFCGLGPINGPATLPLGQTAQYTDYDAIACVSNEAPNVCWGAESGSWANASFSWEAYSSVLSLQGATNNGYVSAKGASTGSTTLALEAFSDTCSFWTTQNVTVSSPTVTITIGFSGPKSTDDALMFSSEPYECSEVLGLHNCGTSWEWNIEGKGVVSDDSMHWTVNQSIVNGLAKGYYRVPPNGTLQSFSQTISAGPDGPTSPDFLQQTPGNMNIYWIDAPGAKQSSVPNGYPVDSLTQVVNFTTKFCSTVVLSDCQSVNWYEKLVVKSGGVLDFTNSNAGLGSASLSF